MRLELFNYERSYNRVTRSVELHKYSAGAVSLPAEIGSALRKYSEHYRLTYAETVALALKFYFGDGKDHLACEHCDLWREHCTVPVVGGQTTLPLLDMGSVVVGLSNVDLGE